MKRLGQHFLKNKTKIIEIIKALNLSKQDFIIEIGPGHGELTKFLATNNQKIAIRIIAIEKDKRLVKQLRQKFSDWPNLEIITGDVLKELPSLIKNLKLKIKNFKLVGNIPFYITGRLLRIISELAIKPSITVLTIQKEVAQRICAKPPKTNLLAAAVQFWAKPEIIDYISKKDFQPAPEVEAAIIKFKNRNLKADKNKEKAYYEIIRIIFKQPRKTIINNLTAGLLLNKKQITACCQKMKIPANQRPQYLKIKKIKNLSDLLKIKSAAAG